MHTSHSVDKKVGEYRYYDVKNNAYINTDKFVPTAKTIPTFSVTSIGFGGDWWITILKIINVKFCIFSRSIFMFNHIFCLMLISAGPTVGTNRTVFYHKTLNTRSTKNRSNMRMAMWMAYCKKIKIGHLQSIIHPKCLTPFLAPKNSRAQNLWTFYYSKPYYGTFLIQKIRLFK